MRILIGFLILLFGAFMTIKAEWFFRMIGSVDWAEKYLGAEGGSRLFFKLLGVIISIVGLLIITNLAGEILKAIFGPTLQSGG